MSGRVIGRSPSRTSIHTKAYKAVEKQPSRMTTHQLNKQIEQMMEEQLLALRTNTALAQTRKRTSKVGALISATVSGLKNKLLFPLKRKNDELARNPDKNGFLDYSHSPTEGGYNSRKYKKPTILSKKPKKPTVLTKKPTKPTVLTKKPKKPTVLPKKVKAKK